MIISFLNLAVYFRFIINFPNFELSWMGFIISSVIRLLNYFGLSIISFHFTVININSLNVNGYVEVRQADFLLRSLS
jgi:hypothetical protein